MTYNNFKNKTHLEFKTQTVHHLTKRTLLLGVSLGTLLLSTLAVPAYAQISLVKEQLQKLQPVQRPAPTATPDKLSLATSKEVRVNQTGDILVVAFNTSGVTYWSFPESNGTTSPQLLAPNSKTGLKVNADGARGLYLSYDNGVAPNFKIDVTGTMANAADNPALYVAHDYAAITQLKAGQHSGMQTFHGKAKTAAQTLQAKAVALEADFSTRIQQHIEDSVLAAQAYKDDADAIIDLTRLTPQGEPGSKIKDILMRFKAKADIDKAEILAKANVNDPSQGYSALIPDIDQIMQSCERQAEAIADSQPNTNANPPDITMLGMVGTIVAADDIDDLADDALNNNAGLDDTDTDTPQPGPSGTYREEIMDTVEFSLEGCYMKALEPYKHLTPQNVDIPNVEEQAYIDFATEADTLRATIESAMDSFQADMENNLVEAQFHLSPNNELAYQAEMLKVMLPVDTTGEIAATLASITNGAVAVKNKAVKNKKIKNKSATNKSTNNMSTKSSSSNICEAADYAGLLNLNIAKVAVLVGTPFNDKLTGGSGIDVVFGLNGNDCIKTKGGIDVVFGMQGNDSIETGDHHDFATGNRGDDILMGGSGKNYGNPGALQIWLGNLLDGGGGDDTIYGWGDNAASAKKPWTDVIFGDGLAKPADRGVDNLDGTGGIDFLFGQSKDDTLSMEQVGKIVINGVEQKFGSFFFGDVGKDSISGSDSIDFAFGNKGDDTLEMGKGIDFAFGQKGADTIDGQAELDILFGGPGDDVIEGGGYDANDPNDPYAELSDLDIIFGGEDNDKLTDKTGQLSLIVGNIGDDYVYPRALISLGLGNTGEDFILGGPGFNLLFGGKHNDTVRGGNLSPNLVSGDLGNDWVNGGENIVSLNLGGEGADIILGGNPFQSDPAAPNDGLFDVNLGNTGHDYIDGQGLVDLSFGGNGNDVVKGGDGRGEPTPPDTNAPALPDVNVSFGDVGNDCIMGGGIADVLIGGADDDRLWNSGLIAIHLGLAGNDISFGSDYLINSDIVLGDNSAELANLGGGPDLVFGFAGADHIKSDAAAIVFSGADADYVQGGMLSNIILGGADDDHITVGNASLSVIFGGGGNDKTKGGAFAFGNSGNDQMQDHRFSFGGPDNDIIKSREGMLFPFSLMLGGAGHDHLITSNDEDSRDFGFGNSGADKFDFGPGKNRAWGGKDADAMNGYYVTQVGSDKKDKLRGGRDNDSAWGNSSEKDKLKAETKTRDSTPSWAPLTAPVAPTLPTVPEPSCPLPTDFDRAKGDTQAGSSLNYQDWMDDFWEE